MNLLFRNIFFYYALIVLPIALVVMGLKLHILPPTTGFVSILVYALIYRPIVDYYRLKAKGIVNSFNYFDTLFWPLRFFKELYWK